MTFSGWMHRRLLVPRWRSFARTAAAGELRSLGTQGLNHKQESNPVKERLDFWTRFPSLATAAEVVEAAICASQDEQAVAPAKYIVENFSSAMPMVLDQALYILQKSGVEIGTEVSTVHNNLANVKKLRASLRVYPRDAIGWTELALQQVVSGHASSASRSISVALALAPHNRHVLRSAARFYLHNEDRERAHDIIARNAASRSDPWLAAAEIALARAATRSPKLMKIGEGLLTGQKFSSRDLSELAGAMGTEYLIESRRGLRRFFKTSLEDPTANALAQGEWASREVGEELVPSQKIGTVPEAFEALAFHNYREQKFSAVPSICEKWARIDELSIRPFEFGSAAAGYALDFVKSAEMARLGLSRRPNSASLLNALAYALGSSGDVAGAVEALQRLSNLKLNEREAYVRLANYGLVYFRANRIADGIAAYRTAIEGFNKISGKADAASARTYLAREAFLSNHEDYNKFIFEAEEALKPFKKLEANLVLSHLRASMTPTLREVISKSDQKQLDFDRLKNIRLTFDKT